MKSKVCCSNAELVQFLDGSLEQLKVEHISGCPDCLQHLDQIRTAQSWFELLRDCLTPHYLPLQRSQCPDPDELSLWVADPESLPSLAEHIAGCEACQAEVGKIQELFANAAAYEAELLARHRKQAMVKILHQTWQKLCEIGNLVTGSLPQPIGALRGGALRGSQLYESERVKVLLNFQQAPEHVTLNGNIWNKGTSQPGVGYIVKIVNAETLSGQKARSDENGFFQVKGLSQGVYRIEVESSDLIFIIPEVPLIER